jgi:hypothetical protein
LKLSQEWEERRIKEDGGRGEFKYDILDILGELLKMAQCMPT